MPTTSSMRKHTAILLTIIFSLPVIAQKPEDALANWSKLSPIEKIHLHLDRENYLAGENAWFKAYLYSDYQPDTISTTLYLELVNEQSVVLNKKVLPILFGATNGHLEIPDTLTTGNYYIRAWTPTMLNHSSDFIFRRSIFVYGKKSESNPPPVPTGIRFEFFPEGGNLIKGLSNTVAFKSSFQNGLPAKCKASLRNEKNEIVTQFETYHDGMGIFDFIPNDQKYFVMIEGDAGNNKYELPVATEKGIAISVIPHPQGHFFELKQTPDPVFQAAYMVGQMQHHIVFRQDFKSPKNEMQGVIDTRNLHSGILQITFFNKEGMPLAERLCFVNNKEYIQQATLTADTFNLNAKAKNRFSIKLKDTIQGNFSISVNDADFDIISRRADNIYSQFLLTSDLRGYIHDPAYYFSAENDSVSTALDLLMMTNGWRRFSWASLPKINSTSSYKDPGFIKLSGQATLRDVKKPFDNKALLVYIVGSDSARSMQTIKTDNDGRFAIDSLLFFGKARVMFSDVRGKKSLYIDVHLAADSLTRPFTLPAFTGGYPNRLSIIPGYTRVKMDADYDIIQKEKGLLLEGVTIKVKKKSPIEELEERYARGMFEGASEKTYDLVNSTDAEGYLNIFDYLQVRVPGLDVGTNNDPMSNSYGSYVVYFRQGPSASSMGPIPMTLYLNEVETDANIIATLSPNEIAMVKVFSNFVGAVGNGAGGVLAIYTKKGEDMSSVSGGRAQSHRYTGFSVIKEFYSPNYTVDVSAQSKVDNRITLQWKPDIMVSGVNPTIPLVFYNNDRTKRFRIIVEGMTVDGKMVMIEKIVEGKAF